MRKGNVPKQKADKNLEAPGCSKNMKRQCVEGSKPTEPEIFEELPASPDEDDSPIRNALFNVLILQQIFSNFRTSFLLSTCSLVNKTWNAQARQYVRDYRKCTAANNNGDTTVCEFMQKLDLLCGQMKESGRVVPFNHLKLNFSKLCEKSPNSLDKRSTNVDENLYRNVISELQLKGLNIAGSYFWDCGHHRPLLILFNTKGRELRSLKVDSTGPFRSGFLAGERSPQFHHLEELRLEEMWFMDTPIEEINWLLKDAPNLKKITPGSLHVLKCVPKEILTRVTLHGSLFVNEPNAEEKDMLCTIAGKASGLKQLRFYVEPPNPLEDPDFLEGQGDGDYGDSEQESAEEEEESLEDKLAAAKRQQKYNSGLERLLQTAQQSLMVIKSNCGYPLSHLSHPPLMNLSKLAITLRDENENDWHEFASINFDSSMPRLQEVNLIIEVEIRNGNILYSSSTVRELNLELKTEEFNLRLLGQLFPNVSVLNLRLKDCWIRFAGPQVEWRRAPISVICENWPGLEELKITGPRACMSHNYDADLCGVSCDEASRLRQQDDDYLKKVQTVPIKPSLLTLSKLRDFWFVEDLFLDSNNDESSWEDPQELVSKVTKELVFNRVPQMNVCLPYFPKAKVTTITTRTVKLGWHYW